MYSQLPYESIENRFLHDAGIIEQIMIPEQDNMIQIAKAGAIRSRFFSIDTLTRDIDFNDFIAADYFEEKREANRVLYNQTLFDKNFQVNGMTISNEESKYVSQITTSQMFGGIRSYDEDETFRHVDKLKRYSDLNLLNRERFDIVVPGYYSLFSEEDTTVGTVIDISISNCLLYTSPSPRDRTRSRMPSSA